MAKTISNLSVVLGMTVAPFVNAANAASTAAQGLQSSVTSAAGTIAKITGVTALAAGSLAAIEGTFGSLKDAIGLASSLEQTSMAFETMLGSASTAKAMMEQLSNFAASTPFQFPELASSAKLLLAFGINAEQIIPSLKMLGDLSAVGGGSVEDLARAFGKIATAGKLSGETLQQFSDRGVPLLKTLASQLGVTTADVLKMIEQGKVGFPQVRSALESLTGPGGQFAGMMDKQSKTLGGLWSTLTDNISLSAAKMVTTIVDAFHLKDAIAGLINFSGRAGDYLTGLVDRVAPVVMSLGGKIAGYVGGIFSDMYAVVSPMATGLANLVTTKWAGIYQATASAFTAVYSTVAAVFGRIGQAVAIVAGSLVPVWATVSSAASTAFAAVGNAVTTFGQTLYGIVAPLMSTWTQTENIVTTLQTLGGVVAAAVAGYVAWQAAGMALNAVQFGLGGVTLAYNGIVATVSATTAALTAVQWTAATAIAAVTTAKWALVTAFTAGRGIVLAVQTAIGSMTAAQIAWSAVTKTVTAAQWLLNAALSANPIGLAIAGVAALGAGLVYLASRFVDVGAVLAWCKQAFDVGIYAVKNWRESLVLAGDYLALFTVRTASQIAYLFTEVIPSTLSWFGRNWRDIFSTVVSFTQSVFTNLLTNAANFGKAIWEAIKGNGFNFDWTPLTTGFESAIKEMPKIAERQVGPLEKRLADKAADAAKQFHEGFTRSIEGAKPLDHLKLPEPPAIKPNVETPVVPTIKMPEMPSLKLDNAPALAAIEQTRSAAATELKAVLAGSAEALQLRAQAVFAARMAAPTVAAVAPSASQNQLAARGKGDDNWLTKPEGKDMFAKLLTAMNRAADNAGKPQFNVANG